eukprot:m.187566 g.187566  ORF g.187566 m.187566 type:complete len:68 (-) comp16714_c0_seq2:532-735(-)
MISLLLLSRESGCAAMFLLLTSNNTRHCYFACNEFALEHLLRCCEDEVNWGSDRRLVCSGVAVSTGL